jgi:hypothetical protein
MASCRASGVDAGGRCVEDAGCRCWCAGPLCGPDADADAPEECPADAIPWPYPPIWERADGEEWAFDPPTWDVSAYRFQPVPGCERVDIAQMEGGSSACAGGTWADWSRVALDNWVTVCTPRGEARAAGLYVLDTTTWTMSLMHIGATNRDAGFTSRDGSYGAVALMPDGVVWSAPLTMPCGWRGCDTGVYDPSVNRDYLLRFEASSQTVRVIWYHDAGERGTLSLHASSPYVLQQQGWDYSEFHVYDTFHERWIPMATFEGHAISGVWRVDFSGERAVWDAWSGHGIMTAVVSRPEETSLIGYTGDEQWSPTVSGDVVCWNSRENMRDENPQIRCANLRTGETWAASADLPAEERVLPDDPQDRGPIVASGPWVAFTVARRDVPATEWMAFRLYNRDLRRSFLFDRFAGFLAGVRGIVGDFLIVGFGGADTIPGGYYRCDLRLLFPEAYPPARPPDGARPHPHPGSLVRPPGEPRAGTAE